MAPVEDLGHPQPQELRILTDAVEIMAGQGQSAQGIIGYAAPYLAAYLVRVALSHGTPPHWGRIDAAKYLLSQHLAQERAAGLVDERGNRIVSYRALVLLAEEWVSEGNVLPPVEETPEALTQREHWRVERAQRRAAERERLYGGGSTSASEPASDLP